MNKEEIKCFFPKGYETQTQSNDQNQQDDLVDQIKTLLTTFRVDIKNIGSENNAVFVTANNSKISTPTWFKNDQGQGVVIEGSSLTQKIIVKAQQDGNLTFWFRGQDKWFENIRFPVWIDYKSIKIDGKEILPIALATWHDKPFKYEMPVKDGQEVLIEFEQQYHSYSSDELENTVIKLDKNLYNYLQKNHSKEISFLTEISKKYIPPMQTLPQRKSILINFCDFCTSFNKNNWIVNTLKKYYDIKLAENPDFLFYSCFGSDHLKYQNCVKIFLTGENVIPNFNECDYAQGFDYLNFEDRYFRKNYVIPSNKIQNRSAVNNDMFNRRFCNFIYSNASSGEGTILRQEFCKKLMTYKKVDCPGKILHNLDTDELAPRYGDWSSSKLEFLKKYKFTIAFENSSSNGYTTEKLFQPLQSFSIPIYWGNPLVTRDFNPKAFINCNEYDNDFDAVIERVKELDNDPDKYLAMLRESPMQDNFDFDQAKKFENWIIHIIEKGNKPFNKDPRDWDKTKLLKIENEKLKQEIKLLKNKIGE